MIFGKTNKEKRKIRIKKAEKRQSPKMWFAWHPVKIYLDGRWIWRENVIKTEVTDSFVTYEIAI